MKKRPFFLFLLILVITYGLLFPFFMRNPDWPVFFNVYSVFNGTLEHQSIDANKTELSQNFEDIKVGAPAPDFSLPDAQGNTIRLSDFRGQPVFLTFWASWCPTCRKENKHLAAQADLVQQSNLRIIGVSLDRSKTNWEKAIFQDRANWVQLSDLKGTESPVASMYGVYVTPTTFLLDSAGVVIAKNLRGEALDSKLLELF
ncbi:MAG: TlpA disulfide reductase family protein [Bacteroidota bacterium]